MNEVGREGVLVVDKPSGPTSHDVVALVRRLFGVRRAGHCGTLDPLATGVLVLCLGVYTRLSEWLSRGEKEYETTLFLGGRSDTGDRQGHIVPAGVPLPQQAAIAAALPRFEGSIAQVPPAFSAVKINGVRSYRLARRHQEVRLEARQVQVSAIELLEYAPPRLQLRIACSAGTYIRSLAADLGEHLGCGAYVEELRRLRSGELDLAEALTVDQLREVAAGGGLEEKLIPPRRALAGLTAVVLAAGELEVFAHGGVVRGPAPLPQDQLCAVYGQDERLWGLGRPEAGQLRPVRVFAPGEWAGHARS